MKLKIGGKLVLGFLSLAVIGSGLGLSGIFFIRAIADSGTRLYQEHTVPISQLLVFIDAIEQTGTDMRDLVIEDDSARRREISGNIREQLQNAEHVLTELGRMLPAADTVVKVKYEAGCARTV